MIVASSFAVLGAITGNSFIVLGVILILVMALMYGLYTRRGSGINPRPWDGSEGAPGAKGQEELSGRDEGEGSALNQHGSDSHASERDGARDE